MKKKNSNQNSITDINSVSNTFKTEVLAGVTTFVASIYLITTNAFILSDAGIAPDAAMMAIILTCAISTLLMGFLSNNPLIIVPGIGINSLFTYTLVKSMNMPWQEVLGAVFVSGIIFTVIASTKLTPILMNSIPDCLKRSITVGVGFLIILTGLQKSGIVSPNVATILSLGSLANKETMLSIITLLIIFILEVRSVKGSLLISMIFATVLSLFMGITSLDNLNFNIDIGALSNVALNLSFKNVFSMPFVIAIFSITIVIIFENMGLLYGTLDCLGKKEDFQKSFKVSGISNIIAGILGTSPTIVAAENFSGISAGGRGKVAAYTSSILFILCIFLIPLLKIIPNSVVSAIIIYIGILMIQTIFDIKKGDMIDNISVIITIALIPLTYNTVTGISFGFITYTLLKIASNKYKEIPITMYVITALFTLNFAMNMLLNTSH